MTLRAGWAALALALPACGSATGPQATQAGRARGWTRTDKAAAVRRIGLPLPASARIESAAAEYGMDDALRVVVTMPAADWAALAPTIPAGEGRPLAFSARDNSALQGADGWAPADLPGLRTAQISWRGSKEGLTLGVAPEPGGRVRLFVLWFQL